MLLFSKYSRAKDVVEGFQSSEEMLKSQVETLAKALRKSEDKYDDLRKKAEHRLQE